MTAQTVFVSDCDDERDDDFFEALNATFSVRASSPCTFEACVGGQDDPGELSDRYEGLTPQGVGRLGEELAVRYLKARGYEVLERNYRCPFGEADVVCRDEDDTILVEVKTRRGEDVFPEEAVDGEKMARYRRICLNYLLQHEQLDNVRFDVVGVNLLGPGVARLHHLMGLCAWDC